MRQPKPAASKMILLLHDFQNFHGASLDADAAGDALGSGALGLHDHNLHGAGLDALAAADALLLVDHVDAGLGILGDGLMLTGLHALAALDAGHGLGTSALGDDLDTAEVGVKFLIECVGAGADALQTGHALGILFHGELLHIEKSPLRIYYYKNIIHAFSKNFNT